MLIMLVGLCYGGTSPIIVLFGLFYCCMSYVSMKHNMLYVYEKCYESYGKMWELAFHCMMWILVFSELTTGTTCQYMLMTLSSCSAWKISSILANTFSFNLSFCHWTYYFAMPCQSLCESLVYWTSFSNKNTSINQFQDRWVAFLHHHKVHPTWSAWSLLA